MPINIPKSMRKLKLPILIAIPLTILGCLTIGHILLLRRKLAVVKREDA